MAVSISNVSHTSTFVAFDTYIATADRSGTHSLYAEWSNFEIMFHVSTMLPYTPDEDQQLERKRHIGNDVIVLVFQDEDSAPIQPELIRSYFNHVFIVVRPVTIDGKKYYRCVRIFLILCVQY